MVAWIVSRPHTRNTLATSLLGQRRVARIRRDHQQPRLRIDFRSRDRGARAQMADHGSDARRHQFVGRGDRLLRIAVVVDDHQLDPLAEDAAGRVQLGDASLPSRVASARRTKPCCRSSGRRRRSRSRRGHPQRTMPQAKSDFRLRNFRPDRRSCPPPELQCSLNSAGPATIVAITPSARRCRRPARRTIATARSR